MSVMPLGPPVRPSHELAVMRLPAGQQAGAESKCCKSSFETHHLMPLFGRNPLEAIIISVQVA